MARRGVYAGSFDPMTNGHFWMLEQAASLFDEVIIAVGDNPDKRSTFTVEERLAVIRECTQHLKNVTVDSFLNLYLVDYAKSVNAQFIVRGIRNLHDYEFERGMRNINADVAPDIRTLFLMPPREYAEISSGFVKGLVGPEGWEDVLARYVPQAVFQLFLSHKNQFLSSKKN